MTFFDGLKMVAGLVFFLFGMNVMSGSLEKMAGGKLERILKKMTANPFVSVFLGAVITIAIQSSSATTVMLVGLVNSGIMQFSSTVCVLYGANIGTTLTAWILSLSGINTNVFWVQLLKPQYLSPVIAIIGIVMLMMSKDDKKKSIGSIFVGFTVLIYGMIMMSDSVSGLANSPVFADLLVKFNNPILGVLIGTVFTGIIQSSAASVGILQALSLTGGITYSMAVPIVLGQNIGTCVTGLLSCIGTNAKAKRVAMVQTLINVIGTLVFLPLYYIASKTFASALTNTAVNPVSIAMIHSIFNILTVSVLLPLTKKVVKLTEFLVKDNDQQKAGAKKRAFYLDERLLRSPSVAITECDNHTGDMCKLASDTILMSLKLTRAFDQKISAQINENETVLDLYEDELGTYLVKLSAQALSQDDSQQISKMLHTIGDFERLGDHALNLDKTAHEIHDKKIAFSPEAAKELDVLTAAVSEIISMTAKAYIENDLVLASRVEPLEQVIDHLTADIKTNHIARLQSGNCTIELGFVLSDLLTNCERISDHCSNIAVAVIEVRNNTFDTHQYLNGVKYGNSEFNSIYDEFSDKYVLPGAAS